MPLVMAIGEGAFGRYFGHEGALKRDPRRNTCPSFHYVRIHKKPESQKRTPHRPSGQPDLRFPTSRSVRNKFLLFIRYLSLWYFVLVAGMD